jgi:hypothetical protein
MIEIPKDCSLVREEVLCERFYIVRGDNPEQKVSENSDDCALVHQPLNELKSIKIESVPNSTLESLSPFAIREAVGWLCIEKSEPLSKASTRKKPTKKKRGRPKGSKNKPKTPTT